MKRYAQTCAVARALDVVGGRWNLLVVWALSLGLHRHRDVAPGLRGIPSNALAARSKDLQAAGVVERRTLHSTADVAVYELTAAGWALLPVLKELLAWGERFAPQPAPDDAVELNWSILAAAGRPSALACEIWFADERLRVGFEDGRSAVRRRPASNSGVSFCMSSDTFNKLMAGQTSPIEALRRSTVDGVFDVAHSALQPFAGAGVAERAMAR